MSSDMFPWMSSYEIKDLPDYAELSNELLGVGKLAIDNNIRLSFHPGQFCVLASDSAEIVNNSIKAVCTLFSIYIMVFLNE